MLYMYWCIEILPCVRINDDGDELKYPIYRPLRLIVDDLSRQLSGVRTDSQCSLTAGARALENR